MRAKPLPRPCRQEGGKPKLRYETRAEAKAVARKAVADDVRLHVYRCPHCGYFHLATVKEEAA